MSTKANAETKTKGTEKNKKANTDKERASAPKKHRAPKKQPSAVDTVVSAMTAEQRNAMLAAIVQAEAQKKKKKPSAKK